MTSEDFRTETAEWLANQRDQVASFVSRISRDPHLAEDIAQEAVLRALEGRGCPSEYDAALRWLKRTAYHLWVDNRRRDLARTRRMLWQGVDGIATEHGSTVAEGEVHMEGRAVELSWLKSQLPEALQGVPDLYRCLIRDRYYRDTSFQELSQRSGLSVGNIKTRLYRGRKALARILRHRVRKHGIQKAKETRWK